MVQIIQQLVQEIENSSWQPKFIESSDLDFVADAINLPHEDYPLNVNKTKDIIKEFCDLKYNSFTWRDAIEIQTELFRNKISEINRLEEPKKTIAWNLPNLYIDMGLRNHDVCVGQWNPPTPLMLPNLINYIFPCTSTFYTNEVLIINDIFELDFKAIRLDYWYKLFQTIHPLNDLNGRVGGIIIAVLNFYHKGVYLTVERK